MQVYGLTDSHLGHKAMVTDFGRPENFEEEILGNLSKVKGDILVFCGDFCFGNHEWWHTEFLKAASGFKRTVFVLGNHDMNKSTSWLLDKGWSFVCREFVMELFGKNVIFTHGPVDMRGKGYFDLNIHGHLHGKGVDSHRSLNMLYGYNEDFHIDLAPEKHGYKPLDLKEFIHPE